MTCHSDSKPLCPYCGKHNGHPDGVEMELCNDEGLVTYSPTLHYAYTCPVCLVSSPWKKTKSDALSSALRRFQPLQKPLALEEVDNAEGAVFFETNLVDGYAFVLNVYDDVIWFLFDDEEKVGYYVDEYGKTWRCWRTRPTDEERAAAKWEEH